MPWWYRTIRAARWLGVAPWDLAAQPVSWLFRAEAAQAAEAEAETKTRKTGKTGHPGPPRPGG